jgi:hypothetical protein
LNLVIARAKTGVEKWLLDARVLARTRAWSLGAAAVWWIKNGTIGVKDATNPARATVRDFGRDSIKMAFPKQNHCGCSKSISQSFPGKASRNMPWVSMPAAGGGPHRWRRGSAICTAWMRVPGFDGCKRKLAGQANVSFYKASLDAMPLADCGVDFGYSLGVLRHLPLKPWSSMLVYIYYVFDTRYYAFDNWPVWLRLLWRASDYLRHVIARAPFRLKSITPSFSLP